MANILQTMNTGLSQGRAENYVSVFERYTSFDQFYEMAQMFARSQFVPETFKDKPENCLIALDLALSLKLKPTSLFPHLYVIHGLPALSAQFMIALVNRSEKFSLISWDEGEDGYFEYEAYGKTLRAVNYYAQAYFTEKSTGKEYRSTRVDVKLARANGWFSKDGSKWKTMPREMCHWRSASWLIKNYAPETVFGLDFADELEDFDATPQPQYQAAPKEIQVHVATVEDEPDPVDELVEGITNAETMEELKKAGARVMKFDVDAATKDKLRKLYMKRSEEISSKKAIATETNVQDEIPTSVKEPVTVENETIEEEPVITAPVKKTRKKTTATKTNANEFSTLKIIQQIKTATNTEELEALSKEIQRANESGVIDNTVFEQLLACVESRSQDLEEFVDEEPEFVADDIQEESPAPPTDEQLRSQKQIEDAMGRANEPKEVDSLLSVAEGWINKGYLTKSQLQAIIDSAQQIKQRLSN